MGQIVQNQIGEIDKRVVVDLSGQIFSLQRGVGILLFHRFPLLCKPVLLPLGEGEPQLFDVVQRVADLVNDAQGDERVRGQVGIHVGMQIRAEFRLLQHVGLDDGPLGVQLVVLGLGHERLGNSGDRRLHLHPPIRIDIGDLGIAQPEDVKLSVVLVYVGGHLAPDDLQPVPVQGQGQAAELCQLGDQIARLMVRRSDGVVQDASAPVQIHNDVLLLIQIKPSERRHVLTLPINDRARGAAALNFCIATVYHRLF